MTPSDTVEDLDSSTAPSASATIVGELPIDALPESPGLALRALLAYGHFIFRYRNAVVPIVIVSIGLLTRPQQLGGDRDYDLALDVLGVMVALCGQALRVLVIGLAYIRRGGVNKTIGADKLVTDGVFAHCRHPLYVGNFLIFAGLMLIWNAPAAYLFGLGGVGVSLYAMARAEEAFLQQKFGAAYATYCRRVNRFVPDLRGLTATLGRFSFDWKRVLRKDYGTAFAWMTTAIVFLVVKRISFHRGAGAAMVLRRGALAWLCVAGLWGVARWLKKTRRLQS